VVSFICKKTTFVEFHNSWFLFHCSPVLAEYRQGNNPSLDVLYNRHIIFGALFDKAVNDIGADYVVSGHYARTTAGENIDKWTRYLGIYLVFYFFS